jgi:hypothetical protein
MTKKIAPVALQCLKDALTNVYWYKSELRSFLSHALSDPAVLAELAHRVRVGFIVIGFNNGGGIHGCT